MIAGIGSDIVELDRIRRLLAGERGRRFSERVLTHAEREIGERRESGFGEFVAGRFAAKEAVSKALGCGIGGQVGFRDIEIIPDERGRPVCPAVSRCPAPPRPVRRRPYSCQHFARPRRGDSLCCSGGDVIGLSFFYVRLLFLRGKPL